MRIVHLSDFHITNNGLKDIASFINKPLIEDLQKYNNDKEINLILFSGDLIDKGGCSFDRNIDQAFITFEDVVINPILKGLNIDKSRFIFAPGNHDVDSDADSVHIETGLKNNLKSIEAVSKYIDEDKIQGIERILSFKNFEKKFHSNDYGTITNYQSCYVLEIEGKKVGITAFNTAWRYHLDNENDFQNLILGVRQISEASKYIENCDIKIALMHHQFDCLAAFDLEAVQPYIEREYDLLFCGHKHRSSTYHKSSIYGDIFISIAPSNSVGNIWREDQRYINGYSIIDYDLEEKTFTIHNRKHSYRHGRYISNTELAPDGGIEVYSKKEQYSNSNKKKK